MKNKHLRSMIVDVELFGFLAVLVRLERRPVDTFSCRQLFQTPLQPLLGQAKGKGHHPVLFLSNDGPSVRGHPRTEQVSAGGSSTSIGSQDTSGVSSPFTMRPVGLLRQDASFAQQAVDVPIFLRTCCMCTPHICTTTYIRSRSIK